MSKKICDCGVDHTPQAPPEAADADLQDWAIIVKCYPRHCKSETAKHAIAWLLLDDPRLSKKARKVLLERVEALLRRTPDDRQRAL
jgi:hypothetical protein